MEAVTVVFCDLKDCFYYRPEPDQPRKCRCAHPDKPRHLDQSVCPLYKMDWQKKLKAQGPPAPMPRRR